MKILMVGTKPPPFHGQSIAFGSAVEAIVDEKMLVSTSFRKKSTIESFSVFILYFFKTIWARFFFRPQVVYFLCSRSYIGLVRDLWLLLLFYRSPAIICNHLHGSSLKQFYYSLPWLVRNIVARMYKRVDRHAVLIDGMQEQLSFLGSQTEIKVIPNYFPNVPSSCKINRDYNSSVISLIYLSSIVKTKGIFDVVSAVEKLIETGYKVKLTIAGGFVGDAEMSAASVEKSFFDAINSRGYVEYVGIVNEEKKYQLLGQNHIFILPTYYISEAVPLSIIEAMRMGCCIITTNYKYLPLMVKNRVNGMLVCIKSPTDIGRKIEILIKDRKFLEIISKKNIKEATKKYSEHCYQNAIRKFVGVN
ncbi:MAG: glycosyltransferase [Ectothiorhodospiraceae bacterium]|nr:glycosyltransferase [Ectothiorhodospiraceae bacterium]